MRKICEMEWIFPGPGMKQYMNFAQRAALRCIVVFLVYGEKTWYDKGNGGDGVKDFPVFTTEYGVASLTLREIPYQGCAYVVIRDSLEPEKLLEECVGFCRACGAERVYATGHPVLEKWPVFTALWEMRCQRSALPDTDAALFPVVESTLERWREIYNEKVGRVPNGAWMTRQDGEKMLKQGDGYFVHRNGKLLGIGMASGETLSWVASVCPGAGREVVAALNHALAGESAVLTVASENQKAVQLYDRMGFVKTREISRWFWVK